MRSIEILLSEHHELKEAIDNLEILLDGFQNAHEVSPQAVGELGRLADFFARDLILHTRKEDEGLFPALASFLPLEVGPLAVMRIEHEGATEHLRGFIEGVSELRRDPLASGKGAGRVSQHGRALIDLLRDHLYKEEQVLFPLAKSRLGPEQDAQIVQKFDEIAARPPQTIAISPAVQAHP